MTDTTGEPLVQLASGSLVSLARFDLVETLRQRGCRIAVTRSHVSVTPSSGVPRDTLFLIRAHRLDVRLLVSEPPTTVH
jgi:hypothetical protein